MTAKLAILRLEDRSTPAVGWVGGTSEWNEPTNWSTGAVPTSADTVVLSGGTDHPPVISATGPDATAANVQMTETCTYDLTIDGTLTTNGSLIQPTNPHGYVGNGTLILNHTAGATYDGSWVKGYAKVKNVTVQNGAILDVWDTFGQLGPDVSGDSNWYIGGAGTGGTLLMSGTHTVGFDQLLIVGNGVMDVLAGGALQDPGYLLQPPNPQWTPFAVKNFGKVEIGQDTDTQPVSISLNGGSYTQLTFISTDSPTTILHNGALLFVGNFNNAASTPDDSVDIRAGKLTVYEAGGITSSATDMNISDATIEFYSPGVFAKNNGPATTSELTLSATKASVMKEALIKNTPVKFLDWNPAGRYTSATQVGGRLRAVGNLKLDGSTALFLRINISAFTSDQVTETDPAGMVTLNGNGLKLSVDLRNPPNMPGSFGIPNLVSGPRLVAPAVPFGGGFEKTGSTAGLTVSDPTLSGNSIGLTITKMM